MTQPHKSFKDSELYGILKPQLTLMRCIGGPLYWEEELRWNAKRYLRELYTLLVALLITTTLLRIVIAGIIYSQSKDLLDTLSIIILAVACISLLIQSVHSSIAWREVLPFFEEYTLEQTIQVNDCGLLCHVRYSPVLLIMWAAVLFCSGTAV